MELRGKRAYTREPTIGGTFKPPYGYIYLHELKIGSQMNVKLFFGLLFLGILTRLFGLRRLFLRLLALLRLLTLFLWLLLGLFLWLLGLFLWLLGLFLWLLLGLFLWLLLSLLLRLLSLLRLLVLLSVTPNHIPQSPRGVPQHPQWSHSKYPP